MLVEVDQVVLFYKSLIEPFVHLVVSLSENFRIRLLTWVVVVGDAAEDGLINGSTSCSKSDWFWHLMHSGLYYLMHGHMNCFPSFRGYRKLVGLNNRFHAFFIDNELSR